MSDNSIFVGDKPFLNYVTGIVMQFTMHNEHEVIVKARGNQITRAVDVAEAAAKRFLHGKVRVRDVQISSDPAQSKVGERVHVSNIAITLERMEA